MTTTREHPRTTIYRFQAPAGGFLRLFDQAGRYGVESDTDPAVIEPTLSFDSARHQFEHLLVERYGFEFVHGPSNIWCMDTRTGKPLVIEHPRDRPADYGSW